MAQVPSVGRIVHYQSHGSPNGQHKSEPRAAIITAVKEASAGTLVEHSPSGLTVDLCVLNPTGMYFDRDTPFSESPRAGHWSWPPYVSSASPRPPGPPDPPPAPPGRRVA